MFLLIGRNEIMHGRMTMGIFGAFIILLFNLYDPVRKFAYFYNSFQQAMGASSSIFGFFDTKDDVKERPHAKALKEFAQSVQFEDVGFSYSTEEGEHQILHNVDLEVRAGEVLALVGPSGAGKSTLVNLIPRFFDVTSGASSSTATTFAIHARIAAPPGGAGYAGDHPLQRHCAQQHRLRPARREARCG
jgi:subfamily B ATP-binding cassette protein MsbA